MTKPGSPQNGHKSTIAAQPEPLNPAISNSGSMSSNIAAATQNPPARDALITEIERAPNIQPDTSLGESVKLSDTRDGRPVISEPETPPSSGAVSKESSVGTKMTISEVGGDATREQAAEAEGGRSRLKMPPVPSSSIQFQADWKRLRRDREMLTQYFKVNICC